MLVMNIMEMMGPKNVSQNADSAQKSGGFAEKFEKAVAGTGTFKETKERVETSAKPEAAKVENPAANAEEDDISSSQEDTQQEDRYVPYAMIPIISVNAAEVEVQPVQPAGIDAETDMIIEIGEKPSVVISQNTMGELAETPVAGNVNIAQPGEAALQQPEFSAQLLKTAEVAVENADANAPVNTSNAQLAPQQTADENPAPMVQAQAMESAAAAGVSLEAQSNVAQTALVGEEAAKNINNLAKSAKENEEIDDNILRQVMDETAAAVKQNAVADGYKALNTARPVTVEQEGMENEGYNSKGETAQQVKQTNIETPTAQTAPLQNVFSKEIDFITNLEGQQAPSGSAGVKFQIIEQVTSMISEAKSELTLQLKPHHLGGLQITLTSDQNGITAKLVTSSKDAHMLIQSEMAAMQEVLRDKGVHVVEMEVIYDQFANTTNKGDSNGGQGAGYGQSGHATGGNQGGLQESTNNVVMMYEDMSGIEVLAEQGGSVEFSA